MNDDLRRQDDTSIREMRNRFDRHLEIYANNGKEMAGLKAEVSALRMDIKEISNSIVHRTEFSPIKNIVYGFAGLILISFVGALITLILK